MYHDHRLEKQVPLVSTQHPHNHSSSSSSSTTTQPSSHILHRHSVDFLYNAPPGTLVEEEEEEERPEDSIPDIPENRAAREFLAKAPRKGLWTPLGKDVKVMKCWRCGQYGHRTGDRECDDDTNPFRSPLFHVGNIVSEGERRIREDPMSDYLSKQQLIERDLQEQKQEQLEKVRSMIDQLREEDRERRRRRRERKNKKRRRRESRKNEKRKKSYHDSDHSDYLSSSYESRSDYDDSDSSDNDSDDRRRKRKKSNGRRKESNRCSSDSGRRRKR